MLPLLFAVAHASEGFAGLVLPNASPMEAGHGYAGLQGVALLMAYGGAVPVPGLQAGVAPDDRFALTVHAAAVPQGEVGLGLVGARYLAVDGERFRVAPWLAAGGMAFDGRGYGWVYGSIEVDGVVLGGVALEVGGPRFQFDVSVPLVGVPVGGWIEYDDPTQALIWLAGTELGFNWRVGERHEVRLGQESMLPTFAWRWYGEHVYTEVAAGSIGVVSFASLAVGGRF